jgi:hypothetical protein
MGTPSYAKIISTVMKKTKRKVLVKVVTPNAEHVRLISREIKVPLYPLGDAYIKPSF